MCAPKAPTPPSPQVTASSQTSENVSSALANQQLSLINTKGPNGSLTYDQTGTYDFTDPLSGTNYSLPKYTATTTLSDQQQKLQDTQNLAEQNLAQLGADQSGRIGSLLSSPLDTSSLPAAADRSNPSMPTYGAGPTAPTYGSINDPTAMQQVNGAAPTYQTVDGAPDGSKVTGTPTYANQTGDAGLQTSAGDFATGRQQVEDALMSRMDPQLQKQGDDLQRQLAARGVMQGSAAYDRAMQNFGQTQNDARMSAIINAGQQEASDSTIQTNASQMANQAKQQTFANANDQTTYNNTLQQQGLSDRLAVAGQNNATDTQNLANRTAVAGFNNSTQQQQQQDALARAGFNNQATQQDFTNNAAVTAANNATSAQGLSDAEGIQSREDADTDKTYAAQQAGLNAQDTAHTRALGEAYAARDQPINEISSLLSGSQVSNPVGAGGGAGGASGSGGIPTTDIAQLLQQNYANQMGAYGQKVATQNTDTGAAAGVVGSLISSGALSAMLTAMSDRRAKKDIVPVGKAQGRGGEHRLYGFRYKGESGAAPKHIGVMAQEAEKKAPEAVITGRDGLKRVNYSMLFGAS